MDNSSRSERTRGTVIHAALAVIAREGAGRLTLDAIAREGGISKGALMHHFPSKEAVLKALLAYQVEQFEAVSRRIRAEQAADAAAPCLATEIAALRETQPELDPVAFAVMGAVAQEPALLAPSRERATRNLAAIRAEAADPDLATLRWMAARGLAITAILGLCPLPAAERDRLYGLLLDEARWPGATP